MPDDISNLLQASEPSPPNADRRRMFKYLLPTGICIATFFCSWLIEARFPQGDSRNFSGPCILVFLGPWALVYIVLAIREALRPQGMRALAWGLAWNLPLAIGLPLTFWIIVKFGWLKHV